MSDYSHVLGRLAKCKPYGDDGRHWRACCPTHDDRNPSLGLWIGRDGELRAKCYAKKGCTFAGIAEALHTEIADWFPPDAREAKRRGGRVADNRRVIEATYDYEDIVDGAWRPVAQVVRYAPNADGDKTFIQRRPDGKGGWIWQMGGLKLPLYRLRDVIKRAKQPVFAVEGEKDVESLRALGLVATTNAGGAGKWRLDHGQALRGRRVVIIPDNDEPGKSHACEIAGSLVYWGAASIRIVHLDGPEGGDVSDWLLGAMPGASDEAKKRMLVNAVTAAPEWAIKPREAKGDE